MQEITIMTENRVGALAEICEILGNRGINIESISAQGLGESGLIRVVTGDATTAAKALSNRKGFSVRTGDILIVKVNDEPGELGKIARKLARAEIDIESMYLLSRQKGVMEVAIKASDMGAAMKAIK
ncbi:TPA: ACT domain-containing protein [Candidatus Micrarchaeota archaeon]|nr:ACT domain-containing protein [Candidatus Micrarchaeota archaeon]HIH29802.1 ACT domain-containing protein [Candidatus Micrarchaeota archaeon]